MIFREDAGVCVFPAPLPLPRTILNNKATHELNACGRQWKFADVDGHLYREIFTFYVWKQVIRLHGKALLIE